jgi:hypothetical protein
MASSRAFLAAAVFATAAFISVCLANPMTNRACTVDSAIFACSYACCRATFVAGETGDGVGVFLIPLVGSGVGVGESFGILVGSGMGLGESFGILVGSGMGVGESFGILVGSGVGVGESFGILVGSGVGVGKSFGILVGSGVGVGLTCWPKAPLERAIKRTQSVMVGVFICLFL